MNLEARNLPKKGEFGGFRTAGAVTDGRLLASPCHRPRWFRATETETGFIENQKPSICYQN